MATYKATLGALRDGFTFIEVMVVVVIVGILAAVAIPQFGGVTADAKASALQGALGGVRSSIAGFRAKRVIAGETSFPTLVELLAAGTVLQEAPPTNPFNQQAGVQSVSRAQAEARAVLNSGTYGWNYFVDNGSTPATAIFYANCEDVTTVSDGGGGFKTANQF